MFKRLLAAAVIVFTTMGVKAGDGPKIASKVQKVVVFLNGAQVTRTATVSINPGNTELVFGEISPGVDVQSIQVHADGEFTILSVKHELNYLGEELKQKQVVELQAQQKVIRDKIDLQNSLMSIYQQEEIMLGKNQTVKADNLMLDVVKLKQALDFQTERLILLKEKQQAVSNQVGTLNKELQKYNLQIADITRGSSTVTSNILVTVSSKVALQSAFTLSYVVHNAGWYPSYDIRAKNITSPVNITYKANVTQQTGEEWKNVKLTLSTGNPTVSGNKPELSPDYLNLDMSYADHSGPVTRVQGRVFATDDNKPVPGASVSVKGTTVGAVTDINGNFSLQVPPGAKTLAIRYIGYESQERAIGTGFVVVGLKPTMNQLNEVVVMGYSSSSAESDEVSGFLKGKAAGVQVTTIPIVVKQTENQTNVEFNIENPYTIPSDGKQCLVEISQNEIRASYQYYVAPKINTDVFLTAQLTDWNKYNFLSGEASLYFEGTFIGKTLIDTHNVADTLNLSLGTDKGIVVTRTLQKEFKGNQSLGSNRKETRDWLIDIKNHKNQQVNLLVEDQVPVSQTSSIAVEAQETSGAKPDQLTGKVSWNFLLNSQDNKKVQLKYQVKYPKNNSSVIVQ